ncbi:unnamed protein product, partial [Ectocarpus sp. 8 AP-2014]
QRRLLLSVPAPASNLSRLEPNIACRVNVGDGSGRKERGHVLRRALMTPGGCGAPKPYTATPNHPFVAHKSVLKDVGKKTEPNAEPGHLSTSSDPIPPLTRTVNDRLLTTLVPFHSVRR